MTAFDIYIFTLSLIVLILLTTISVVVVLTIIKMSCRLIRAGEEDENILKEANRIQTKGEKLWGIIDKIISLIFAIVFLIAFALSTMVACTKNVSLGSVPVFRVVNSDSMSKKHEKNEYLVENNLNNQFDTFDLIITYEIPPEEELQLYDVVVYKYEDMLIVHRIVEIQPPSSTHPNATYYRLQGDAEERADVLPVRYDQMVAIYRGERIPFVGSFVKFMQSPAGWICIVLVLVAMIAGPIADKKLATERAKRLQILQTSNSLTATELSNYNGEEELENKPLTKVEPIIAKGNGEEVEASIKEENANAELAITDTNDSFRAELVEENSVPFAFHMLSKNNLTFSERLEKSSSVVKERYAQIINYLKRIDGVRVIKGKKFETYKCKAIPLIRLSLRGKTLNAYIGLNCKDYENTKYIFENVSSSKTYKNYPMRVKITSDRKTRWVIELLENIAVNNGLTINAESKELHWVEIVEESTIPFAFHMLSKNNLTFNERLEKSSNVVKERYAQIINYLKRIDGVRVIKGKKFETYKYRAIPLIRLSLRGKTLNAYIGLNCKDYENTKYIFEDVSSSKTYKNYPMRVKITSDRKTRWVIELLQEIESKNRLKLFEAQNVKEEMLDARVLDNENTCSHSGQIEKVSVPFAFHMLSKNNLTFSERLEKSSNVVKERYAQIINYLKHINGVRVIKGKKFETYKCKAIPLIRLSLRGKTLNAYIGLNCKDYENTKYIFEDVSSSKTYKNYPMRVKITSDRKTRWVIELISKILNARNENGGQNEN